MAKFTAKKSIVLVNGYNYSTMAMTYEAVHSPGMVDVTGFGDGGQNFIPGLPSSKMNIGMYWDSTATVGTHAVLSVLPSGAVTIIPEGFVLGNNTVSMPFTLGNYSPHGDPAGAIQIGTLAFEGFGSYVGIERGWALAHVTITDTTTGVGFVDPTGANVTGICGGTLHIWTKCATDTYVVKIQQSATIDGVYDDLITFAANGSALTVERQQIASSVIKPYRRFLATRTGTAANPFGFSVHFWHLGV